MPATSSRDPNVLGLPFTEIIGNIGKRNLLAGHKHLLRRLLGRAYLLIMYRALGWLTLTQARIDNQNEKFRKAIMDRFTTPLAHGVPLHESAQSSCIMRKMA